MNTLYLMFTITDRNKTRRFQALYESCGVEVHFLMTGSGTAGSELLEYFGLERTEKAVLLAVVTDDTWRELQYFRRFCGVSNGTALYTATLGNARIAGIDNETGSIAPGKSADLIVCRENPLNNLTALRHLSHVIFRGKFYAPKVKPIRQVEQELDNYL